MKTRSFWIITSVFVILIAVPFIIASFSGGDQFHFGGFLLNPLDGNSYLAKMREGWNGSWKFDFLYSPRASEGAYIFLFYLFLGHLSRWVGLQPIFIFHIIRILAAVFLLTELWKWMQSFFPDEEYISRRGFIWLCFGAGLGWIALLFGAQTSDFWVAETYPFLSCFINPHFPLSLALILLALRLSGKKTSIATCFSLCVVGLLQGMILPFAVVITGLILVGSLIWEVIQTRKLRVLPVIFFLIGGAPMLIYQLIVVQSIPAFTAWNAQNLTPAPPLWDFIVSLSPAILLAVVGIILLILNRSISRFKWAVLWFISGIVLTFVPFSLQRRFMLGLYIPSVTLALLGVEQLKTTVKYKKLILNTAMIGSMITVVLLLLIAFSGVVTHSPLQYMTSDQYAALSFLKINLKPGEVVLANPQTSMYIPGQTGLRVVYGHPFETINAVEQELSVNEFLSGSLDSAQEQSLISTNHVQAIMVEKSAVIGQDELANLGFVPGAQFGSVMIFINP